MQGLWPFGALLIFDGDDYVGFGSVTHVASQTLMTVAHNLPVSEDPSYVAIFYDLEGKRETAVIQKVLYRDDRLDFAILEISKEKSLGWHLPPLEVHPIELPGANIGSFQVDIWAVDPVGFHPGIYQARSSGLKATESGVFTRRSAIATKKKPEVQVIAGRSTRPLQWNTHPIFIDGFLFGVSSTTGNSGVLVTSSGSDDLRAIGDITAARMLERTGDLYRVYGPSGERVHSRPGVLWVEATPLEDVFRPHTNLNRGETRCWKLIDELLPRE